MPIHLSTQANNVNWKSSNFWHDIGVKRIVLARELSIAEISDIRKKASPSLELEIFIHGAMCISYSGRCLLSNYMAYRDSNRGLCAHPCRWKYYLSEETRPGEYYPIYEDDKGTYIYNSKDLCTIEHIPEIIMTGINSLKIEGRMKSSFYVACVVSAYRKAIDRYYSNPQEYKFDANWLKQVSKVSHRMFSTGFYFGKPSEISHNYSSSSYIRNYDFVGLVLGYHCESKSVEVEQRNRISVGEQLEIITPDGRCIPYKIPYIRTRAGTLVDTAPHPQMIIYLPVDYDIPAYSILARPNMNM